MNAVRTRFAPSPTGSLHVGNARIAVLNWLYARHHGGSFILRIEDTDPARTVEGAESTILEDLRWLGLEWDEGPGVEGPFGDGPHAPYRQSARAAIYREHAQRLVHTGAAFPCFCSPDALEEARKTALAAGRNPHYPGTCRELDPATAEARLNAGTPASIRFRVPHEDVVVHDPVRGDVRFPQGEFGDFIILRSDGLPTYNFAVVVDDALMEISHVIRGAGHLSNTPRQQLLYLALGYQLPGFVHVPMVLGPDRQKLSKRHGARPLGEYRREGYHPDAVVNYLSLLSWSSASGDEFLTRRRLVSEVSIDRIGAADVVFDPGKLRWLSSKHIDRMTIEELTESVEPFIDRDRYPLEETVLPVAVDAVRTHLANFSDINEHLAPFVPTLDAAGISARDSLREDRAALAVLEAALRSLPDADAWTPEAVQSAIDAVGAATGLRGRRLYEPLRTALTGRPHGPPLAPVLFVMGRAAAIKLLSQAVTSPDGTSPGQTDRRN